MSNISFNPKIRTATYGENLSYIYVDYNTGIYTHDDFTNGKSTLHVIGTTSTGMVLQLNTHNLHDCVTYEELQTSNWNIK